MQDSVISRTGISPQELSAQRQQVLLDVAAQEFLAQGYSKTSLAAISEKSRVSKATIYRHYDGKEALFVAVVESKAATIFPVELDLQTPVKSLHKTARRFNAAMADPVHRELIRMMIAEYPHMPETVGRLQRIGITQNLRPLREFFVELQARKQMVYDDAERAAGNFMALALGNFRLLLEPPPPPAQEERRLKRDIDFFIRGCGIVDTAPGASSTSRAAR